MDGEIDRQLELQTLDALRGAADLRQRLVVEMATGTPAVSDLAYAVKVRVKEDYKIYEKVIGKRARRPDYGVDNLRDIVGLRIVTLYRLDALVIIPAILDVIQSGSSDTSLFKKDSIEEIIIYSTNPNGDPQGLSARLMSLFKSRGLGAVAKIDETPSNYTSIHMVAWGRGKYRESYREIPVEIQIRTAFEDVWGEIDHALKYKRVGMNSQEISPVSSPDRLQTSFAHLNVLKTMIDGIAQYADQIKLQITELDGDRLRSSVSKPAEDPLVRLNPLRDLPELIKTQIEDAVRAVQPALEAGPAFEPTEKLRVVRESLAALDRAAEALAACTGLSVKTLRETDYVVSMQRALLLFEIGNLVEGGAGQLTEAAKIYARMEAKFPNRMVVRYRYARVLDALGDRAGAIEKLRGVLVRLEERREPTPKDHWIRAAAPRVLGVLLWEEADALRRQSIDLIGHRVGGRRVELLREAYLITQKAYEQKIKEPNSSTTATERAKAANNLLYYALELNEAVGSMKEMGDLRVPNGVIETYLEEIGAVDPSKLEDGRLLDTSRRAYEALGDLSRELEAAERFLSLVEQGKAASDFGNVHTEEMINAARRSLSKGGERT